MVERRLTVGQVTELLGVDADAVHAWHELGLLHVDPDGRYDADAVERVRLIRFAARRGIPATDIARLGALQPSATSTSSKARTPRSPTSST